MMAVIGEWNKKILFFIIKPARKTPEIKSGVFCCFELLLGTILEKAYCKAYANYFFLI